MHFLSHLVHYLAFQCFWLPSSSSLRKRGTHLVLHFFHRDSTWLNGDWCLGVFCGYHGLDPQKFPRRRCAKWTTSWAATGLSSKKMHVCWFSRRTAGRERTVVGWKTVGHYGTLWETGSASQTKAELKKCCSFGISKTHRINGNRAPDERQWKSNGISTGALGWKPSFAGFTSASTLAWSLTSWTWKQRRIDNYCSVRQFCHCPPVHLDACVGFTLALELVVEALPDTLGHCCRAGSRSLDCRTLRKSRGRYMYYHAACS